jgi:biotin operon repressor
MKRGEVLILKSLKDSPQSFEKIIENTKLSRQAVAFYLKTLQKKGLIEREIDTRKYKIKKIAIETLLFHEISEFLEKEEKKYCYIPPFFFISSNEKLVEKIIKYFSKPELKDLKDVFKFLHYFNEINQKINEIIEELKMENFKTEEKEIIKKYKKLLLKYVLLYINKEKIEEMKKILEKKEKELQIKNLAKDFLENFYETLHPSSLNKVEVIVNKIKTSEWGKEKLTEKEEKEAKEILKFLENKRNKKIYEEYLNYPDENNKLIVLASYNFNYELLTSMFLWFKEQNRLKQYETN